LFLSSKSWEIVCKRPLIDREKYFEKTWFVLNYITWFLTLVFFYYSNGKSSSLVLGLLIWSGIQSALAPELMTFEGRNFDILAGITAPIIGLIYLKNIIGKRLLLVWNFLGLCLVLFIFINGVLSAELPFQQFGFDQPNRAITFFPFILLPSVIVPVVIWTHLTDMIQLWKAQHPRC